MKEEVNFSDYQYEFFDGLMASDGHISPVGNFAVSLKYKEFTEYINNILGFNSNIYTRSYFDRRINKTTITHSLHKQNSLFKKERLRWYPNGKKVIPDDFRFSPISILSWYLGDGSLTELGIIKISTESFKKENLENTIVKYLKTIGIKCWVNNSNQVKITAYSKDTFLSFIGKCPIKCYSHKWNWNDASEEHLKTRNLLSSKLKRRKLSEQHRERISKALIKGRFNKNRIITTETRLKLSNANSGSNNPMFGKKHSNESKLNISINHGSKPFLVFKDNILIGEWTNKMECARALNIDNSYITKCLKNTKKSAKGYTFKHK